MGSAPASTGEYKTTYYCSGSSVFTVCQHICRPALQQLSDLVQRTGALIVLSSAWRLDRRYRRALLRGLATFDLKLPSKIIGRTTTKRGVGNNTKGTHKKGTTLVQVGPQNQIVAVAADNCPLTSAQERALQIAEWLQKHGPVKSWVAIDDLHLQECFLKNEPPKCVRTEPFLGLNEKVKKEALAVLLSNVTG